MNIRFDTQVTPLVRHKSEDEEDTIFNYNKNKKINRKIIKNYVRCKNVHRH